MILTQATKSKLCLRNSDRDNGALARILAGSLYGTTQWGGTYGFGTVFKLDRAHGETVLYSFRGGTDGGQPLLGYLVHDMEGNLYGTTQFGGTYGAGTVFKLDCASKETVLYSFRGGTDGAYPYAGLVRDGEGNLYGTTNQGGASSYGTVFKVDKTGTETLLHTFTGVVGDGAFPYDDLLLDAKGNNLYGTTFSGGSSGGYQNLGYGVVFRQTPW